MSFLFKRSFNATALNYFEAVNIKKEAEKYLESQGVKFDTKVWIPAFAGMTIGSLENKKKDPARASPVDSQETGWI